MADNLTCSICFHAFDVDHRRPWDIGCGHSFCETCLRQHPSSFRTCPECRKRANNPHVNIAMLRMLDAHGRGNDASAASASATSAGLPAAHNSYPAGRGSNSRDNGVQQVVGGLVNRVVQGRQQQQLPLQPMGPVGTDSAARVAAAALAQLPNSTDGFAGHQAKIAEWRSAMWLYLTPIMGLMYLLSPLDIIPDFLPLIGWIDDLLVLAYVACSVHSMLRPSTRQQNNTMRL